MATSEIRTKPITKATFTKTLASLANAAGRQTTMISNSNNYPGAFVYARIKSGASAPTVNRAYKVYLLRGDDASSSTYRSDGAGASDAALTIENSILLGQILVTATANKNFYGEFDTMVLGVGELGPEWGLAIFNDSGQALSTTEGDHFLGYIYKLPEAQ